MYIWERADWPSFTWKADRLLESVASARHRQGQLLGKMVQLGFDLQLEAQLNAVSAEVVKSSEIEGDLLDPKSVRSSVARRLGVSEAGLPIKRDRRADDVVAMMMDATQRFAEPLTASRLKGWQAALFPTGYSGLHPVRTGAWRDDSAGPMQVVSGAVGRSHVHFEAPPAARVEREMRAFLAWFNAPPDMEGLTRVAIAHLWFVTVHPFDDGNGRVARAIADLALAQLERSPQRFYSLSSQIRLERDAYYDALERTQKGKLDVTEWLLWFFGCFERAIEAAESTTGDVLRKAEFWKRYATESFTPRQTKVLGRVLSDFDGKLTAKKWAALGKCSVDSAQRDLQDLVARGVLVKNPGGSKNTSYALALQRD